MKSGYVSIIGKPNSGKSTLLNRILGEELSIVTHKAQTTRRNILGIFNLSDSQIIFLDTPGIHQSAKRLNKYMSQQIKQALKDADIIVLLVDVINDKAEDIKGITEKLNKRNLVIALNKIDLVVTSPWDKVFKKYLSVLNDYKIMTISAKTGHNVDLLIREITNLLPEGVPYYPQDIYTSHSVREIVAEIIREQTMLLMQQEIPYSIAVVVDDYKEEPDIHRINASIVVEKESQKGMVIGSRGKMIKEIGKSARVKIEKLAGIKVFLKLFVRVEKDWTKDSSKIKSFHEHY